MRKIIGKFIVRESNIDSTDPSAVSYCTSNKNSSNEERVRIYDVCLRDDSNGDLLLINSSNGHCMLIGNGGGFIPSIIRKTL